MSEPMWQPGPERVATSNLTRFMALVAERDGRRFDDYEALLRWSVEERERFWELLWDFAGIRAETRGERTVVDGDRMPGARFFPDARFNFAENLLRRRDGTTAIVFRGEDKIERRLSWQELHDLVSRTAKALAADGVGPGDRVAGFMPNMPETIVAMLATASLGAIWSSCSPDFGIKGVMDRFGQIEPKVLFTADGYHYNGKSHSSLDRARGIAAELPALKRLVVVSYLEEKPDLGGLDSWASRFADYIAGHPAGDIAFHQGEFNAPLYIMYSSGTTGMPKCIVHGAGGTLLKHVEEHLLQSDLKPGDRLFYFTTCGWMMWNWLVSGLVAEATLLLYDGSPFYPDGNVLFDYADAERCTQFGVSAKYIDSLANAELAPMETHDLSSIRTILSTGSPLAPLSFDYVYEKVKRDVCLSSMSGGTDLIGSFVGGNPIGPVWRGEIQKRLLGMATDVFDEDGNSIVGTKGELVCTKPFPSMPLGFWNDPDGRRYHEAYFERYPNIWCHGDYVELTEHGGMIIYGRSDAVLNPGGVRIGTAEIYRQVESLDEVAEGLVVGQDWQNDVRVVLFVRLKGGVTLDAALEDRIRRRIRENATPRHVPARIVAVADIPRTLSGKIVELAVRDVIHGRAVRNKDALANPEALDLFADLEALKS
ncbi:acetoacetate--CoA ligase [Oceanibacterium hippocampi]|uniref:Acetyl-coenzyme A synthetase n=1 Tax=Oceanibacterium hippocampi TaxID=745714 RepID=A0A1Y5R9I6_9PROT|nr:acetoacetate--CoA ligase [Oceanibacterium hippocampi]SLN12275.1 Acetyl-coenzyme A synthetase [Oceanibacterium hippocampi]